LQLYATLGAKDFIGGSFAMNFVDITTGSPVVCKKHCAKLPKTTSKYQE